jgi:hypothetical protein
MLGQTVLDANKPRRLSAIESQQKQRINAVTLIAVCREIH